MKYRDISEISRYIEKFDIFLDDSIPYIDIESNGNFDISSHHYCECENLWLLFLARRDLFLNFNLKCKIVEIEEENCLLVTTYIESVQHGYNGDEWAVSNELSKI